MHVMGEHDTDVPVERSESLVGVCQLAKVLKHGGGHDIPKSDEDRESIVQFLRDCAGSKDRHRHEQS